MGYYVSASGALPYTWHMIIPLVRSYGSPPHANDLTRSTTIVNPKMKGIKKRYPGCLVHAVRGVFYSVVADRRQPNPYHNIIGIYLPSQRFSSPKPIGRRASPARPRPLRGHGAHGENYPSGKLSSPGALGDDRAPSPVRKSFPISAITRGRKQ